MNGIRPSVFAKTQRSFFRRQREFDRGSNTHQSTMHKIQFAKGVQGPKEMWRFNSLPGEKHRIGCFAKIGLYEENARIVFLALLLVIYLCFGALCFSFVERQNELEERDFYKEKYEDFMRIHCPSEKNGVPKFEKRHRRRHHRRHVSPSSVNCSQLIELLDLRGNFSLAGLMSDRPKWDFPGSFYFVGTVVSTIGEYLLRK